jgi:hypothetical protein
MTKRVLFVVREIRDAVRRRVETRANELAPAAMEEQA